MVCQNNLINSTNYKGINLKLSNDILPITINYIDELKNSQMITEKYS
jgi:hypothetical protein